SVLSSWSSVFFVDHMAAVVGPGDPYAFLAKYDTAFLVDDSGSMVGSNWTETCNALKALVSICVKYDSDGVDLYFLNRKNRMDSGSAKGYRNVTSAVGVMALFSDVKPDGGTPTGQRLADILRPYVEKVEEAAVSTTTVKPLNLIVVTDGAAGDDVESVVVA